MNNIIKSAFKDSLPVMSGYVVVGMTFAILLNKAGYGILWALLCSLSIYSGSMQFILITLITSGASLITVALTTMTVNARYLFYGISLIDKYKAKNVGKMRNYLIFALTDETYSLVCDKPATTDKKYYLAVSMFDQLYWVGGTFIGSMLGEVIPIDITGIEFAMTALFIVVVVEQWLTTNKHTPTMIGFICSMLCLWVFGSSDFLIPTMVVILSVLSLLYKKQGGECYE